MTPYIIPQPTRDGFGWIVNSRTLIVAEDGVEHAVDIWYDERRGCVEIQICYPDGTRNNVESITVNERVFHAYMDER